MVVDQPRFANYECETCVTFRPATETQGTTPLKFVRFTVVSDGVGDPSEWSDPMPPKAPTDLDVVPPSSWFTENVSKTSEFGPDFNFREDRGETMWKYEWDLHYEVPSDFITVLTGCKNVRIDVQMELDLGPPATASFPYVAIDVSSLLVDAVMSKARSSVMLSNMASNRAIYTRMSLLGVALKKAVSQFLIIHIEYENAVRWPKLPDALLAALFRVRFNIHGWGVRLAWKPAEEQSGSEGWEVVHMPSG